MLIDAAPVLLKPVFHHINQTILTQLGWSDFTHRLDAYLARRQGTPMMSVDLFPTLSCVAAGGSPEQALSVTAAWVLFILSARIFDDLADGQKMAEEWHSTNSQTTLALALFALGAANSVIAQIPSGTVSKEISYAFNQALALAAKAQQESSRANYPSLEQYLATIAAKTGFIFAVGAWSGAMMVSDPPCQQTIKSLYEYGLNIGIMDQIIDDCQDLAVDLAQGVWTLPVIYTVSQSAENDRHSLLALLGRAKGGEVDAVNTAVAHITTYGSLTWCLTAAFAYQQRAITALKNLPTEKTIYLVEYAHRNDPTSVI